MDDRSIFLDALEKRSPEERAAFLNESCGGDAELRMRVESLLAAHEDAGSFLERPADELTAASDSHQDVGEEPDDAWRELLEPCDVADCLGALGPYEVMELVGRGGMGVVLRGRDPKLNRTVAIKLLAPELAANAMAVRRFVREAQAAAAVTHGHVVTIYAIHEQSRPPMIAMEYIDGQSLQQKIDRGGALEVTSILRIGMQTAAGLSAAHRQGLMHRDVKPANILLENGIERVKLSDFGLARAVDDIGMTRTGTITGTPQYMSPEQAQGERVDLRTDLFSLGCVMYAMCTGQAAFRADSAVAVMHQVVHEQPKRICAINEDIPDWLCEIVEKLLEKNADDRFQTAAEVEELLGEHLQHLQQPNSVPRPARIARSPRLPHREDLSPDTAKRLRFVRNVLAVFGFLSLLWFFANLAMPYYGHVGFAFTMPGLLLSLVSGLLALNGAWNAMHHRSYGWTLLGSVILLFPFNVPQMLGLFFTVWASTQLWRVDVRQAFDSEQDRRPIPAASAPAAVSAGNQDVTLRAWLRRVPAPAWIATILFATVYMLAAADGGQIIRGRVAETIGVGFYLLATVFVLLWGFLAAIRRLTSGSNETKLSQIQPWPLFIFFTTITLITGGFIALWTPIDFERPWEYWKEVERLVEGDDVAPWEDFRWYGEVAYAKIDGVWYEVQAIQQIPPADMVVIADSKYAAPKRKIVEDLVDVLLHMERYTGNHVQLSLRELGREDELTWLDKRIEMTAGKRRKLIKVMYPDGQLRDGPPTSETAGPPAAASEASLTTRPNGES